MSRERYGQRIDVVDREIAESLGPAANVKGRGPAPPRRPRSPCG
jgi:hypothetical protein